MTPPTVGRPACDRIGSRWHAKEQARRTGAGNLEFGVAVHPTRNLAVGFDHGRTVLGDDIGRVNRVFLRYEFARD